MTTELKELRAQVADLRAQVKRWEDKEVYRASDCCGQEDRAISAEAERDALRQAHWDGRAIGGFDNDGDPTPRAVVSDFARLIRKDWQDMRDSLEEAREETDRAEAERDRFAVLYKQAQREKWAAETDRDVSQHNARYWAQEYRKAADRAEGLEESLREILRQLPRSEGPTAVEVHNPAHPAWSPELRTTTGAPASRDGQGETRCKRCAQLFGPDEGTGGGL